MINWNGKLQASAANLNRSFHYGDGIFETIRQFQGKLPFWKWHINRLLKGLQFLQLTPPPFFTPDYLKHQIELLQPDIINARIRITIFRAAGGKYTPSNNNFQFVIEKEALVESQFTWPGKGLTIGTYPTPLLLAGSPLSNIKSCNSLPYILAALHKKQMGWDDCLLLNQHQRIAEASSSNIFWVKDHDLFTPPLDEGGLDGTIRQFIIDQASSWNQSVSLRPMDLNSLASADEVFLTNSIQGIRWIKQWRAKAYHHNNSQKVFQHLNQYAVNF